MKKLLAIFMLCFAVFAAKAQVFLLQESFDSGEIPSDWQNIDNDGDTYLWYADADVDLEGEYTHTGYGVAFSFSYNNNIGAVNPDNWLITRAITIPANANEPMLSWWVMSDYADYYAVYISTTGNTVSDFTSDAVFAGAVEVDDQGVFVQRQVSLSEYVGQTIYVAFRHYNCTDQYYLFIDDVEIFTTPTEPTLAVNPTTLNFGIVSINETANRTANVTAYNLTDAIAVSTAAPFAVSLDGETFATTVSMPVAGGTIYVQYAPTAAVADNGTVTLTSGDQTATIAVSGTGFDCGTVTTFPYETNFSNAAMNDCWTIENANEDNKTFTFSPTSGYASYAYSSTSNADDWLISPVLTLTGNEYAVFDYKTGSYYDEKFEVAVIQGTTRTIVVPEMTVRSGSYLTIDPIDLSSFVGDYQIGIHCTSDTDQYYLYITNFKVDAAVPTLTVNEDEIDFGTVIVNENADESVVVSTMLVTEAVEVSTVAPFAVSIDGENFAATATIPATTEMANTTTVYVRFTPTAEEEYSGAVVFTAGELTDTVYVSGNGYECSVISEFPYETDFSDEALNLCWMIEDANNDNNTWHLASGYAYYQYSSTNAASDWLISPTFDLTGNEMASFEYRAYSSTYPEKFEVAIIQGDERTVIVPEMTVTETNFTTLYVDLRSYTGDYKIGIHCTSDADQYALLVTNFTVSDITASIIASEEAIDFGSIPTNTTSNRHVSVATIAITEAVTVSTEAPFAVSIDGNTFAATATIPAPTELSNETIVYVQYAPTAVGTHTGTVTITDGTLTTTIALNGAAVDCSGNIGTLPFNEDFEGSFPPTCWTVQSTNSVTWESKVSENDNSTWAYCNYAETAQDEKLITKTIDFTTDQPNVMMTFDFIASYYFVTNTDPAEQYNLLIYASTDDGATFSTTPVYNMRNDQAEFENWTITSASVDLSSLIGQTTVKLMFNYYGTYGAEMWIDNINITANTVGIEEETAENVVSIYPNPASTMLNVHAENFDNVQVINFLGQVVYSANVTENDFQINVSNLSNGVYFIRLNGENTVTKKFVKK